MVDSDSSPRNITTDHATIKEWVETRGGTPARVTGQTDDASSLYIVREDEAMEGMESVSWNDFFETFETEGLAFLYAGYEPGDSDEWFYDIVERDEIAERADLDSAEIEQSLLEGEVVESEITETTVIEKTVVETDQIESQIVDSELIETNLLDHEIQKRELVGASFAGSDISTTLGSHTTSATTAPGEQGDHELTDDEEMLGDDDEGILGDDDDEGVLSDDDDEGMLSDDDDEGILGDDDESMLDDTDSGVLGDQDEEIDEPSASADQSRHAETETPTHSPVERSTDSPAGLGVDEHVTLDVADSVRTTMEVYDRKTVESRVVDSDTVESDTVESDAVDIDIEGVEETILESDLIEGELAAQAAETTTRQAIPSGAITSERTEGDVIRSQFVERRVVETDSTEHRQLTCEIADSQLVDAVDSRSQIVERAIVDRDADEEVLLSEPVTSGHPGTEEVEAAEASAAASQEAHQAADAETGVMAGGEAGESADPATSDQQAATQPTEDELGKTVVSGDEEVGMVSDVQGETLYVEPHPSLTDKIKAAFEWGEVDEETYPVEADQIESISDDAVHIREV